MPTTTNMVIWIGVLFRGYDDYYALPEEVQEGVARGKEYLVDGLTFREFDVLLQDTMGLGVEFHRHYWSDGPGSFEDLLSKKGEIAQMKAKVEEVMEKWGVKGNTKVYYEVNPE